MNVAEVREILNWPARISENSFEIVKSIADMSLDRVTFDEARDLLIRLLDRVEYLRGVTPIVRSLLLLHGLHPYLVAADMEGASSRDLISYESHAVPQLGEGFYFHAMQAEVFRRLLSGRNVVLSAPTSFGKSAIVDALVVSGRWANLVVLVPTIALIDETRRRLARFSREYTIVTHVTQQLGRRNILVVTQERFIEILQRESFSPADTLCVVDEFYKLDGGDRDSMRSGLLNEALYPLYRSGVQYYMTGPNVDALADELPADVRSDLMVSRFTTVATNHIDASPYGLTDYERLASILRQVDGPTLVYCSTPKRTREVAQYLLENVFLRESGRTSNFAEWLAYNFGREWVVTRAIRNGLGIHNGTLPRALLHHVVRAFNNEELPVLLCTSTLIEGVNTTARNVIILDPRLEGRKLDFFTFSNIRGRAGRMFRSYVGNVYLFTPPPDVQDTKIDIPIISQSRRISDATLLQLPEADLTSDSRERLESLTDEAALPLAVMRQNRGIDPKAQMEMARTLSTARTSDLYSLAWSGMPTYSELSATSRYALSLMSSRMRGRISETALPAMLNALRTWRGDVRELVNGQLRYTPDADEAIERVLEFQRNWAGYRIPQYFMAVQRIAQHVTSARGLRFSGNYSFYVASVENLFLPPFIATLEEYGLPQQVAMKLRPIGLRGETLDAIVQSLLGVHARGQAVRVLDPFEMGLLAEVADGLGPVEPEAGIR